MVHPIGDGKTPPVNVAHQSTISIRLLVIWRNKGIRDQSLALSQRLTSVR